MSTKTPLSSSLFDMASEVFEDDTLERPALPSLGGLYALESRGFPELKRDITEEQLFALAVQLYKIKALSTKQNFFAYLLFSVESEQYDKFKEYYLSLDDSLETKTLETICPEV